MKPAQLMLNHNNMAPSMNIANIMNILTRKHEYANRVSGIVTKESLKRIHLYVSFATSLPGTWVELENNRKFLFKSIEGYTPEERLRLLREVQYIVKIMNFDDEHHFKMIDYFTALQHIKSGFSAFIPIGNLRFCQQVKNHGLSWAMIEYNIGLQSRHLKITAKKMSYSATEIINAINKKSVLEKIRTKINKWDDPVAKEVKNTLREMKNDIIKAKIKTTNVQTEISDFKIMLTGGQSENGMRTSGLENEFTLKLQYMKKYSRELEITINVIMTLFKCIITAISGSNLGINFLEIAWQSMLAQVEESQRQFSAINDSSSLNLFITQFKKTINPWMNLSDSARELAQVFNQARK